MGFTVDEKTEITTVGVTLDNVYYTLGKRCGVEGFLNGQGVKRYRIIGHYAIYVSRDAYINSVQPIDKGNYIKVELDTLTNKEPMKELYIELKSQLGFTDLNTTNYLDD